MRLLETILASKQWFNVAQLSAFWHKIEQSCKWAWPPFKVQETNIPVENNQDKSTNFVLPKRSVWFILNKDHEGKKKKNPPNRESQTVMVVWICPHLAKGKKTFRHANKHFLQKWKPNFIKIVEDEWLNDFCKSCKSFLATFVSQCTLGNSECI